MKVEVLIGLRDAMAPDEEVPLPGQSSRPAEATPTDDGASSGRSENAYEPDKASDAHPGSFISILSVQWAHSLLYTCALHANKAHVHPLTADASSAK